MKMNEQPYSTNLDRTQAALEDEAVADQRTGVDNPGASTVGTTATAAPEPDETPSIFQLICDLLNDSYVTNATLVDLTKEIRALRKQYYDLIRAIKRGEGWPGRVPKPPKEGKQK